MFYRILDNVAEHAASNRTRDERKRENTKFELVPVLIGNYPALRSGPNLAPTAPDPSLDRKAALGLCALPVRARGLSAPSASPTSYTGLSLIWTSDQHTNFYTLTFSHTYGYLARLWLILTPYISYTQLTPDICDTLLCVILGLTSPDLCTEKRSNFSGDHLL